MRNFVFLALLLTAFPSLAQTLYGRVVGVTDGDTVKILDASNQMFKVRLAGIDAPDEDICSFNLSTRRSSLGLAKGRSIRLPACCCLCQSPKVIPAATLSPYSSNWRAAFQRSRRSAFSVWRLVETRMTLSALSSTGLSVSHESSGFPFSLESASPRKLTLYACLPPSLPIGSGLRQKTA